MFDYVRKHTKIMMGLLFLLIIPSFVLFGIDGYNRFREKGQAVAVVGSYEITQSEWDAAHKQEVDRLRVSMPNLDPKLLDSPQARYATLENVVRDRVLSEAAVAAHLQTSDVKLARDLQSNPAIAALRRPDGTLDMEQYRQLVGSQGMTPEMFESRIRSEIAKRQVEAGVVQTGITFPVVADTALNAFYERREVQLARFNSADFAAQVKPTDAELEAYYQANQSQFQAVEQANIEYVVLDINAVRKSITLNEADLKVYYEQNAARLSGTEERRASHILITAAKTAPAAERDKAKARALELLASVRKTPASFSDIARKNSQDPGSAAKGGDLDFFARGSMVKPFEDAAFNLKKGDISDVVESDFGYHIIQVTDIKVPKQKSFEELRASLEEDLKNQQARAKYAEAAEAFTNGVYEQSDSLKPVADRLKLEIRTANGVKRSAAAGAQGALANAKFLSAVFNPDSVEKKRNSEAVEIAPSQLAAARITQYTAAHTLPFAEVRASVQEQVTASRAAELAKKEGEQKLAAWKSNPGAANLLTAQDVSRDQPKDLPSTVLSAVMRVDGSNLPAWVGIDMKAQGYVVVKVNKLTPRATQALEVQKQDREQVAKFWALAENQAYYKWLKERFKVQIKVNRPSNSVADAAQGAAS